MKRFKGCHTPDAESKGSDCLPEVEGEGERGKRGNVRKYVVRNSDGGEAEREQTDYRVLRQMVVRW